MQSDRELMQQALEALEYVHEGANNQGPHTGISWRCASNKVEPAITALRERLAQPEQYQRPQMRRATREEKIDKPGVYWVPVNNIANSEAIPEQISEPEQEPVAQGEEHMNDYAYPTMMAERSLKDLHNAMLENRYDDALLAALNAIVETRMAIAAIKDAKERYAK